MKSILLNLLKKWGIKAVMKVIISSLRGQGRKEKILADDFEAALDRYNQ